MKLDTLARARAHTHTHTHIHTHIHTHTHTLRIKTISRYDVVNLMQFLAHNI